MKTAAITCCAAALVVIVQANYFDEDEDSHGIRKREVNCNDMHDFGGPRALETCCSKAVHIVDPRPPPHRGPCRHHHRGPPRGSQEDRSGESSEEGGPGGPGGRGKKRWGGPPRRGPHGRGPHGRGPPPHQRPGGIDEFIRCKFQEEYENMALMSGGKLDQPAVVAYVVANKTGWTSEIMTEIVSNCSATAEQMVAEEKLTNCTSGAFEFEKCLHQRTFVNCPADSWTQSEDCEKAKAYMSACPVDMGPPPPPHGGRHGGRHGGGRGGPPGGGEQGTSQQQPSSEFSPEVITSSVPAE
ncbi:uncharacterized protein LOC134540750 [Bacillus rossius redtenbacheri]|uniref:uncharacterized protein LOC134540750 n=1 Tax=Bacillus rossius redtenbacheri TaxID=93214 RepID=UPI002FDE6740